jgi:TRAP-type transport system periplasmic protein
MKLRQFALLGLAGLAMACTAPMEAQAQAAPIVMKLGTATINDAQHEWMKLFAAIVERDSGGRIKIEIYPASQLGTSPRMI